MKAKEMSIPVQQQAGARRVPRKSSSVSPASPRLRLNLHEHGHRRDSHDTDSLLRNSSRNTGKMSPGFEMRLVAKLGQASATVR